VKRRMTITKDSFCFCIFRTMRNDFNIERPNANNRLCNFVDLLEMWLLLLLCTPGTLNSVPDVHAVDGWWK